MHHKCITLTNLEDIKVINYAYAYTVHKSQGGGFNRVCYIRENERSLKCTKKDYTAMTRVKNHLIIYDISTVEQPVVKDRRICLQQILERYIGGKQNLFLGVFITVKEQIDKGGYITTKQHKYITEGLQSKRVPTEVITLINEFTK